MLSSYMPLWLFRIYTKARISAIYGEGNYKFNFIKAFFWEGIKKPLYVRTGRIPRLNNESFQIAVTQKILSLPYEPMKLEIWNSIFAEEEVRKENLRKLRNEIFGGNNDVD